ncbi:MAG: FecR domain-containing protein [Candidatus Neomarinimicrobiota bacterium]
MRKLIYILFFSLTLAFASSKVAVVMKVKGDASVAYKESNSVQSLKPGTTLSNQDKITTGENGFVALMYIDDKTVVKILGNSILDILGERSGAMINKSINIEYGKVAAAVTTQKGKEFRVSTPTSVASVKGTSLAIDSDPSNGDSFTLLEGLIEVTNVVTGESTDVQEGETALSTNDGSLEVNQTTQQDLEGFEEASLEVSNQEIRFEMEDENGELKEIIIKFQ